MAANVHDTAFNTVAVVTSTAKTVILETAAANIALKWLETAVSFDGATSSNAPAIVELVTSTAAGAGTSTSVTPVKRDAGRGETIQATAGKSYSAEPTVLSAIRVIDIGQYNGVYHYINPFASPYIIIGGKGGGMRITSPNNCNCSGHLTCEE